MTPRDSWLVRNIKKIERWGDKANSGLSDYMVETLNGISEIVYESMIRYEEQKEAEKLEEEMEELRCNARLSSQHVEIVTPGMSVQIQPALPAENPTAARKVQLRVIRDVILMVDLFLLAISMGGVR